MKGLSQPFLADVQEIRRWARLHKDPMSLLAERSRYETLSG